MFQDIHFVSERFGKRSDVCEVYHNIATTTEAQVSGTLEHRVIRKKWRAKNPQIIYLITNVT